MRLVRTEDAVGCVLAHDVTEIIPGVRKGPAFRKGHVIQEEDISRLLDIGKKNLYVIEGHETMVHEDEAASRLCRICMGSGLEAGSPKEGKIELKATIDGLFVAIWVSAPSGCDITQGRFLIPRSAIKVLTCP